MNFSLITQKFLKAETLSNNVYYIYKDKTNFVEIEAESAQIALSKSDIKEPYKIILSASIIKNIFNEGELAEDPDALKAVQEKMAQEKEEAQAKAEMQQKAKEVAEQVSEEALNEFNNEITTGISAPPMGNTNKIP